VRSSGYWFVVLVVVLIVGAAGDVHSLGFTQPQQPAQDEFIPLDQVPPEDQLPAAPLLITAYAFVWVSVFGYLWSIWRRLSTVEKELSELSRRNEE
jgi:CcmD family protein